MAYRNIDTVAMGGVVVKVAYDSVWGEYRARIAAPRGQINHDADYFTNDKQDAIGTAWRMAEQVAQNLA